MFCDKIDLIIHVTKASEENLNFLYRIILPKLVWRVELT